MFTEVWRPSHVAVVSSIQWAVKKRGWGWIRTTETLPHGALWVPTALGHSGMRRCVPQGFVMAALPSPDFCHLGQLAWFYWDISVSTSHTYKAFFSGWPDHWSQRYFQRATPNPWVMSWACRESLFKNQKNFFKATFPLQLLQNIGYIPSVVQYILVAYLTPSNLYLPLFIPIVALPLLSTGNH